MSILDVPGISKAQLEARVTGITDEVVEARDMAQAFAIDSLGSVIESHAIVLQAPLDAAKATEDALAFKVSHGDLAAPDVTNKIGYFSITLSEAMSLKRSIRTFGAKGNGEDDSVALVAAETWLKTSTINRPLHLVIDIPVRFTLTNKLGAVSLIGVSGWTIEWTGSGVLLMDNLVSGRGTGGGIFGAGPARNITLMNPNIEWVVKPTTRSTGDGFMFKGHPSDANCLDNVRILGRSRIKYAPQTGGIFLGCKDPYVQSHHGIENAADNLHFNACQRPVVHHNLAVASGDDVMALVTYYHATDIGGGTAWQTSRTPYNQPTLGEWNNTDGYIGGVTSDNCKTNALRLAGVNGCIIGPIKDDGPARGMICDAGLADGVQYKWSYLASRRVRVESVTQHGVGIGAFFQVFNRTLALASPTPSLFTDAEINVGTVTSRGSTSYGASVSGMNGVTVDVVDTEGAVLAGVLLQRTKDVVIKQILGTDVVNIEHACSNITIGDIECNRMTIQLGEGISSNIKLGVITSTNSPVNAFMASQVNGLIIAGLRAFEHNTSGGTTNNAVLNIQACKKVRVGDIEAESSQLNAKLFEFGGGSTVDIRGDDISIRSFLSRINRTDAGVTTQGGSFGPLNLKYAGKWRNGTTGAWSAVAVDTYA